MLKRGTLKIVDKCVIRFLMIKDVTQSLRIGVITAKLLMKLMPLIHVNHSQTDLAEGIQ